MNNAEFHNHSNPVNVSLLGDIHYIHMGIIEVLNSIKSNFNLSYLANSHYQLMELTPSKNIDILIVSGVEIWNAEKNYIEYINIIKSRYPEVIIFMYSAPANSLLWAIGDIDAYISLQEPVYRWRAKLLKIVNDRYRPKKKPTALSLTPGEWRVLKELRKGLDMRYIAETEQLSYRRVSALKSSAIRKLGLRNKTDLLVFLTS